MVTVIGLGFVGLTTALGLAECGHKVYGIETDGERLNAISSGSIPFFEPELDSVLDMHLKKGSFIPKKNLERAVNDSDIVFFCVGTPYGDGGEAELTYLFDAIEKTLSVMNREKYRALVVKSTVPPSTTKNTIKPFVEQLGFKIGEEIGIANNPEFLREGHCWEDFTSADRIVIGTEDIRTAEMLESLYEPMGIPICNVTLNTAEFIKYLSNTSLAALISFANEMSMAADAIGDINIPDAFRILHMDKRWKTGSIRNYCYPGCGYGGYCLPKDTQALYAEISRAGCEGGILRNIIDVNDMMPEYTAEKIIKEVKRGYETPIGILGLSFNQGSDDVRNSQAVGIIKCLMEKGYENIVAYDPMAIDNFRNAYGLGIDFAGSVEELADKVEVAAILTRWDEFRNIKEITDIPVVDCVYML